MEGDSNPRAAGKDGSGQGPGESGLRSEIENLAALLQLVQEIAVAVNQAQNAASAFRQAIRLICDHKGWTAGHVYLLDSGEGRDLVSTGAWHCSVESGFEPLKRATVGSRIGRGKDLAWRVVESAEPQWIEIPNEPDWTRGQTVEGLHAAVMFPIRSGQGVIGVMEFYSTHPIERDEAFRRTMNNVGIQLGHALERRRLERRIVELSEAEQRRIGEELHDTLGQQITAVTMLTQSLKNRLEERGAPETEETARIVEHLERGKAQIANLVRGLVPLDLRAADFRDSLGTLAKRSRSLYDIDCYFDRVDDVAVTDDSTAMQLYRIAQEAIHNAVKHGNADVVRVCLESGPDPNTATLRIQDDGTGSEPSEQESESGGMGLRIMRHRASLIDGELEIESSVDGGTEVRCTWPLSAPGRA